MRLGKEWGWRGVSGIPSGHGTLVVCINYPGGSGHGAVDLCLKCKGGNIRAGDRSLGPTGV